MMEFYILQLKTVDVEYIGKYKDERAYSHWMSGFVDIIHVAKCIGVERSISGGGDHIHTFVFCIINLF
jgi:hypothetical protein